MIQLSTDIDLQIVDYVGEVLIAESLRVWSLLQPQTPAVVPVPTDDALKAGGGAAEAL
jgi:hypothetical protein